MALPSHQFLHGAVNWDGEHLSPVQVSHVSACPISASNRKEEPFYFSVDQTGPARQPLGISAFSRFMTDMGSLNGTDNHRPEPSFYSGHKLLSLITDTDPASPSHSSHSDSQHLHSLSFSAPSCSETDIKPDTHYLTMESTKYPSKWSECRTNGSIITTLSISQRSRDDTEPNTLQTDFTGNDKTHRERTQETQCVVCADIISCHKMSDTARRDFRKRCKWLAVGESGKEEAMSLQQTPNLRAGKRISIQHVPDSRAPPGD
uniref:Homeobox B10a n=1 Tax=Cyprinus carpio TaxID=7962 RepID=A0A8C1S260_CYPCA